MASGWSVFSSSEASTEEEEVTRKSSLTTSSDESTSSAKDRSFAAAIDRLSDALRKQPRIVLSSVLRLPSLEFFFGGCSVM